MSNSRGRRTADDSTVDPQPSTEVALQDVSDLIPADVVPAREVLAVNTIVPELYRSNEFSDAALREITTFEDALAAAQAAYGTVQDVSQELGDGFALLKSEFKSRLVGVPLILLEWNFYEGDFGGNFVAVRLIARNPDGGISKYILNDGSRGIADLLAEYTKATGRSGGLAARNGLSESKYTYCDQCNKAVSDKPGADAEHAARGAHKLAVTYYIDTSV